MYLVEPAGIETRYLLLAKQALSSPEFQVDLSITPDVSRFEDRLQDRLCLASLQLFKRHKKRTDLIILVELRPSGIQAL